ncbi:MAG TPA: hypothetical protein VIM73_16810 [Polyangiaceae bacterium]
MSNESSPPFESRDLSASADDALAALERAGARAVALVEAWVKSGNAAAVEVAAERGSGPARKAARRGQNVLRSRGIKVESAPRVVSLTGGLSDEQVSEAWLIAPDPSGTLTIVIAERSVTRRARSAFFYLHDSAGLRSVSSGELSGGRLKEALKRASQNGLEPVRIPVSYARFRIALARKLHKERNQPEPLGMTSVADLLEPVPEDEPHPFDAEGLTLADEDVKEFADRSGSLHALPEFRSWMPPREAVDELLQAVGKDLPPSDKPDPEKIRAVLSAAIEAATDKYFVPERRSGLVKLLKDSALSVLATQGELRALEVVAAIRRIETAGLITDPPHEVPFLRFFFEKAIAALAFQGGGKLQVPVPQPGSAEAAQP